jgi:hypothetical protein
MLMNFTQKHNIELQLTNLTPTQFLNIAIETSKSLGWIYGSVNDNGFVAYTNNGMLAWNAEIRVKIKSGFVDLVSQSRGIHSIEFGRDRENLALFISTFNNLRKISGIENIKRPDYLGSRVNFA